MSDRVVMTDQPPTGAVFQQISGDQAIFRVPIHENAPDWHCRIPEELIGRVKRCERERKIFTSDEDGNEIPGTAWWDGPWYWVIN